MSHKLTLDINCIIDIEENRPNAIYIKKLIESWKNGKIELAVVAVSASENQKSGAASKNFSVFEEKLKRTGLSNAQQLLPPAIWDVFYWDHALWTSNEMSVLADKIKSILFPSIQENPPNDSQENSRWRNRLCDTMVAWSCIWHKWGILVTSDRNFHDHKEDLKKLGIIEILCPEDASKLYAQ